MVCPSGNASSGDVVVDNQKIDIKDVKIIQINKHEDDRGIFFKFHPQQMLKFDLDSVAISVNPHIGTIRGLHFQTEPYAEEKVITCLQGAIFDVTVDLRPQSKTFGKWRSVELNSENSTQIYLPKGIAHGFQTLKPNTIIHYSISGSYSQDSTCTVDPLGDLDITWPLKERNISEKDRQGISFQQAAKRFAISLGG
jgi:dTDP-4-dehydrorhamnose 3,5-epimerase